MPLFGMTHTNQPNQSPIHVTIPPKYSKTPKCLYGYDEICFIYSQKPMKDGNGHGICQDLQLEDMSLPEMINYSSSTGVLFVFPKQNLELEMMLQSSQIPFIQKHKSSQTPFAKVSFLESIMLVALDFNAFPLF